MDSVAAEDHSTFVLVLRFLKLGVLDHAKVKESAKMRVDTSFVQLFFGFLLDIQILSYNSFNPCASAVVRLAELIPFIVDGSHGFHIGFPLLSRHRFGDQVVPRDERVELRVD